MTVLQGWETDVWVEKKDVVIMREMHWSNKADTVDGKPQDYGNKTLLILSIHSKTVSEMQWDGDRLLH